MKKAIMIVYLLMLHISIYSQNTITVYQKDSIEWTDDVTTLGKPTTLEERERFELKIIDTLSNPWIGLQSAIFTDSRRLIMFVDKVPSVNYNEFANYFLQWYYNNMRVIVVAGVIIVDNKNGLIYEDATKNIRKYKILGKAYLIK